MFSTGVLYLLQGVPWWCSWWAGWAQMWKVPLHHKTWWFHLILNGFLLCAVWSPWCSGLDMELFLPGVSRFWLVLLMFHMLQPLCWKLWVLVTWGVHSTTFHLKLRNERFTLMSFMGFPAILSTLQPFQMCIFNENYSKLTFSNGPQVMGKRFMANLHASLDSTWKSRFSKISTRCQLQGGPFNTFWSWTKKWS